MSQNVKCGIFEYFWEYLSQNGEYFTKSYLGHHPVQRNLRRRDLLVLARTRALRHRLQGGVHGPKLLQRLETELSVRTGSELAAGRVHGGVFGRREPPRERRMREHGNPQPLALEV